MKSIIVAILGLLCCLPADAAGRRYALVVGVPEYRPSQPFPTLPWTERDAVELAKVLKAGGYDVVVMTAETARVPGQGHLAPSATLIRDQLKAILNAPALDAEDIVLIAFAGAFRMALSWSRMSVA
ncbi:MAG: hypothetical protein ACKO3T_15550, partial [Planctomycetaceae bacterium]